eukprot:6207066-Pleurochrysis_carterae.AAC.3
MNTCRSLGKCSRMFKSLHARWKLGHTKYAFEFLSRMIINSLDTYAALPSRNSRIHAAMNIFWAEGLN